MGILSREGYELTPRADEAEILVVNTCSFIEPAQKESVDAILEMAEHKKFGAAKEIDRGRMPGGALPRPDPRAGAGSGCGRRNGRGRTYPGSSGREMKVLPAEPPSFLYHDLTPRIITTPKHQAYIKIAEGCDHPCSFCIIPQLRGAFRSRRFESVMREAENLAAAGTREVTLIGQDTTSYGEDLGLRDGLAQLLEKLAGVDELLWVRFLYAYPNRVTQKLLDTLAAHPRLAKYFDMPLQHASRNVLARMKRGSNGDAFLKMIERDSQNHSRRDAADQLHRGISRRDAEGFQGTPSVRGRRENRLDGRIRIFRRGQRGKLCPGRKSGCRDDCGAASSIDGVATEDFARETAARTKAAWKLRWSKALRKIIRLVWEARLEGMAPDIDGKLYLTDIELPTAKWP